MRISDAWSQDVVLKAMCDHIARQRTEGTAADFVLATGDLTFSGKTEEYDLAAGFFDALSTASAVPKERIFCIPGNHDVDRDRQNLCFLGARAFLQDQNRVDALLAGGEDLETLLKRQENYRQFQNSYFTGQDRAGTDDKLAYVSRLTVEDVRLAIVGLDSAWLAGGGIEDHGRLLIGERQFLDAIRLAQECDDAPHIIVGMAHHPFHLLQEFDRLPVQNRIERECQFFHCGHLHEPEARTTGYSGMGCLTIAAGASFETRQSHNTYSVVTLDLLRALRTVKTIRYNPRNGAFSSGSAEEYRIEVRPGDTCSMGELADAMKTYRTALSPWAYYLSALLLDQKAELPIPVQHGHTLGSFNVLQTLPDSDLKRKTVVFMVFKNALRVLYKRVSLSDIFIQHGSAVAQYGTTLEELCGTDSALKERLTAQQNDAQMLAGAEPTDPFFHTGALLTELADAHEWGPLREQAQRHLASLDPTVAIQARRMLALGLAHSDETADKEAAIKLYLSMTEDESAEISDFGILATLLIDARRMVEAKTVVFGGIAKFPANRADYFLQFGHRIVAATGDRVFREQMKAAIAERGRHA